MKSAGMGSLNLKLLLACSIGALALAPSCDCGEETVDEQDAGPTQVQDAGRTDANQVEVDGSTSDGAAADMAVNQAPEIDLDGTADSPDDPDFQATFTEGGGPIAIVDPVNLTVTDDGDELASAVVTITNLIDSGEEVLDAIAGDSRISVSYDPASGVLRMAGPAPLSVFEAAL